MVPLENRSQNPTGIGSGMLARLIWGAASKIAAQQDKVDDSQHLHLYFTTQTSILTRPVAVTQEAIRPPPALVQQSSLSTISKSSSLLWHVSTHISGQRESKPACSTPMASLRRNKTLSPDGQTARFLYTIIKQLDLKSIDWNMVAGSLEITNGHAARMRYSRFKQHVEGVTTQPRAPRTGGKKQKEGKEGKEGMEAVKKGKKRGFEEDGDDRVQAASYVKREIPGPESAIGRVKKEGDMRIKNELDADQAMCDVQIKPEPGLQDDRALSAAAPAPRIKPEPDTHSNPDIWRVLPHTTTTTAATTSPHRFTQDQTPRSQPLPTNPASTIQFSHPSHLQASFPPHHHNPHHRTHYRPPTTTGTISLADLEVAPRSSLPSTTSPSIHGGLDHHVFSAKAPTSTVEPRSLEGSTAALQIKVEQGLEVGAEGGGKVLVKNEVMDL